MTIYRTVEYVKSVRTFKNICTHMQLLILFLFTLKLPNAYLHAIKLDIKAQNKWND